VSDEFQDLSPFQRKLITFWVQMRTSFWYLWGFLAFCLAWVICNKTGIVPSKWHWDNMDLTYLNLLLSILAEVSAITILVYTLRLTEKNDAADKQLVKDLLELKKAIEKR